MSLASGTLLGPYEIQSAIGAGGMGEVCRARDTQLKRDVALKILPSELARDPERRARFDREAQALAALNHPHIAQIHGIIHDEGTPAIVMELVEGPTLAEVLGQSRMAAEDALRLAVQLADALEYAHERGVVHRDLKPANIKITPDGDLKVLDFGLAKVVAGDAAASSADLLGDSPTMTSPARLRQGNGAAGTGVGVILGTAAYMAPEQARGAAVDRRADIWAFGVVVFEMLAGKPCFAGDTVTDVLAAVVTSEPDWTALGDTPSSVRDLLRRCLAKDRRQRLHDIGDARIELERLLSARSVAVEERAPVRSTRLPWVLAVFSMAALGVMAGFVLRGFWSSAPPGDRAVVLVDRKGTVTAAAVGDPGEYVTFSVSEDGKTIVTGRTEPDRLGIWKIDTTTGKTTPVQKSEEEFLLDPCVGRDGLVTYGRSLSTREVWQMPLGGGSPTRLAASGELLHDRSRDDEWLLVGKHLTGLRARAVRGSGPAIELTPGSRWTDQGRFSPDGRAVAYNSSESGRFEVWVVRMPPTGEKQQVSRHGGVQPLWRADGKELYYLTPDGTLMAVDVNCPESAACTLGEPRAPFPTGIRSPSREVEEYGTSGDGQRFVILKASGDAGPLTVLLNWAELLKER